jgi:hypothetical protein
VALVVEAVLLAGRTVGEGNVVVCDVVEEMDLLLLQHQRRGQRVDRRIAPALVEETAGVVERLEVVDVLLGAEPVQIANLEV